MKPMATAMPRASATTAAQRVEVTAEGFQPARIVVGEDRQVIFRRVAEGTCATAVVFPSLGIEKQLPLNTDVAVALPPGSQGELGFQCGMGMYRGKVVAQ
jgi:plastocyanin domain-containing protein